ncbi:MAG TPA: PEGA domain-containing protein [Polyangiales bacterium]|nr:PEGA domain-containing protein [Polyangiales bacterium]
MSCKIPVWRWGTLRINSRPWSQVFIDNKPVGTTPLLNVSVSAGEHSVRLVNSVFGMRKTFDISVGAGENISQVVSLDD